MSTFDGVIREFPDIRIDFFRPQKEPPAPLACFLSHVHSDHLAGLETFRGPFIYCSAATREILLRLERYPCRINCAQGILEARKLTYHKHLKNLLKPIPLDTPTQLELSSGNIIQVTLLDANHCSGSVMFLIEGGRNAVLYTGDIRAEPWWVNSIARNPCMVEYSIGLKTLDRIYLDTSILSDFKLQTKAEGLRLLIDQVIKYPDDTVFYMHAYTYGYEEVWVALSKALKSKIHVDKYKMRIYKSLAVRPTEGRFDPQFHLTKEAPYLVGFMRGNHQEEGHLTLDENVRIHSCEKGTHCSAMQNKPIVWLTPFVAHVPGGQDIEEVGIGGGMDDLEQEAEIEYLTRADIEALVPIITADLDITPEQQEQMKERLVKLATTGRSMSLNMDVSEFDKDMHTSLRDAILSLAKKPRSEEITNSPSAATAEESITKKSLPNRIRFPWARHSSLPELTHLVETFRPKDIWPCTVDARSWYEKGITMRELFGEHCLGDVFEHDALMDKLFETLKQELEAREQKEKQQKQQQQSQQSQDVDMADHNSQAPTASPSIVNDAPLSSPIIITKVVRKRDYETFREDEDSFQAEEEEEEEELELEGDSQASEMSAIAYETRLRAFRAMEGNANGASWTSIGLISTTDHHTVEEQELGGK